MTVTASRLQPLTRETDRQLWNAIHLCMPDTLKVSLRATQQFGHRGMVIVSYAQAPSRMYPNRKPSRRWFKLSGVWLGERDDPKRAERITSILAEAQAVVDAKRATMMGYELRPEERERKP